MKNTIKALLASLLASASLFAFVGCSDSEVGDNLEEAADEVKEAGKEAGDELKEAGDEIADGVKDATN
ncbi:hypothetical protein [Pelagicoccus sp. SDUM812005]|uniref:hypothetical protein n=1 Tax=Pelagicoccus sp. SDUM812005 TaxID=3041257 RepID=UPI00280FD75E|nr:hypothetical protein [Pelagicoccus sp. SDUM812005]MDQ8181748.1 hypothetical protein [Pelagicoccus sp. SDUM812005]